MESILGMIPGFVFLLFVKNLYSDSTTIADRDSDMDMHCPSFNDNDRFFHFLFHKK